jgi:hypothetical protein
MKYFTIRELTRTSTGIRNVPGRAEVRNLELLVEKVLDPVREMYGQPIKVTSGYRSPAVTRKVGGAINSHHLFGMAADITSMTDDPKENRRIYDIIRNSGLKFTQLINEYPDRYGNPNWVHVSYDENNLKCQRLTIRKK